MVAMTLGPDGRAVMIDRGVGDPLLVDDGRRVAENIKFDDAIEQSAMRVAYGITRKTDEKVGDGTTTSMVLTGAIVETVANDYIIPGGIGGSSVSDVDRLLQDSKTAVVEKLRAMAKQVKTEKELIDVATVSVGDAKLGEIIGKMYWRLGKEGHISMEFNFVSEEIETEVVSGYRFSGGYAAPWMITDALRRVCIIDDVPVLIADRAKNKELVWNDLQGAVALAAESGSKSLVVISQRFSKQILDNAHRLATAKNGAFYIVCVRAPSRGSEAFEDMAVYTGGKHFSDKDQFELITKEDLGRVKRLELSEDTCVLVEGKGDPKEIEKRAKAARAEGDLQKLPQMKQDKYERASALLGGVGLIRIGAPTDEERNFLKYKIEDAKYATKQAFKHGIVPGAGQAYKTISEAMSDDDILKDVLMAPYLTLKRNGGSNFKPNKSVVDPVAVEIAALENAVSAAAKLIRIGGAIAFAPKPELDEAFRGIMGGSDDLIEDDE